MIYFWRIQTNTCSTTQIIDSISLEEILQRSSEVLKSSTITFFSFSFFQSLENSQEIQSSIFFED